MLTLRLRLLGFIASALLPLAGGEPEAEPAKPATATEPVGWFTANHLAHPGLRCDYFGIYLSVSPEGKHWAFSRNGGQKPGQFTETEFIAGLREHARLAPMEQTPFLIGADDELPVGVLRKTILLLRQEGVREIRVLGMVEGILPKVEAVVKPEVIETAPPAP